MPKGGKDRAKVYIGFTWGLYGVNDLFGDLRRRGVLRRTAWGLVMRTAWGLVMQERL